jgi:hypothetical protein
LWSTQNEKKKMQIRGEKKNIMPKTMGKQKGRLAHAL